MGANAFPNQSSTGKRQAKRSRVLIAAKLQTPLGEVDARLRDISKLGALVECNRVPPVGSDVVFMRGGLVIPARVAWSGGNRVGLEFQFPIDEHEVMIQLKKPGGAGGSGTRFRRPGLAETLTEDERRLAKAWGVTVGLTVPDAD